MDQVISVRGPGRPQQRRLRNMLLDPKFQLKYAGFAVAIGVFLSTALGAALWRTSNRMALESQKVTQVVEMTVAEDPDYAELLGGSGSQYREELQAYQDNMREQQRHYAVVLVSGLLLFVFGVGLGAIALTHRIAGPVFKLRHNLQALGDGSLKYPVPIRRGDEMQQVFHTFNDVVGKLRARQADRVNRLGGLIERVHSKLSSEELEVLRSIRDDHVRSLRP